MSIFPFFIAGVAVLFLLIFQYKFWGKQAGILGVILSIVMIVFLFWLGLKLGFLTPP